VWLVTGHRVGATNNKTIQKMNVHGIVSTEITLWFKTRIRMHFFNDTKIALETNPQNGSAA